MQILQKRNPVHDVPHNWFAVADFTAPALSANAGRALSVIITPIEQVISRMSAPIHDVTPMVFSADFQRPQFRLSRRRPRLRHGTRMPSHRQIPFQSWTA
jgi:hypothetical protein